MGKLYFCIIALVFSFSLSVSAASPDILAEKVISGGFVQHPERGIRILRNGLVVGFSGTETHELGLLLFSTTDELVSLIEHTNSKMIDENPPAPFCADEPETVYKAFRDNGESIVFAIRKNCRNSVTPELVILRSILDAYANVDNVYYNLH